MDEALKRLECVSVGITSNGPRALREAHEHHQAVACTRPQNHQLSITQKTTAVHPSSHSAVTITLEKNS
ncbi:unnamed protein product [Boreogadus saida]